jgi:hypothetical protein
MLSQKEEPAMPHVPSVRFVAAPVLAVLALLGVAAVFASGMASARQPTSGKPQMTQNAFAQPDTTSPDWKAISDDLGIWIGQSDHAGVRGRLYVKRGDAWLPVAIDGAADIRNVFPVGK